MSRGAGDHSEQFDPISENSAHHTVRSKASEIQLSLASGYGSIVAVYTRYSRATRSKPLRTALRVLEQLLVDCLAKKDPVQGAFADLKARDLILFQTPVELFVSRPFLLQGFSSEEMPFRSVLTFFLIG
jgi:hypothetical protein